MSISSANATTFVVAYQTRQDRLGGTIDGADCLFRRTAHRCLAYRIGGQRRHLLEMARMPSVAFQRQRNRGGLARISQRRIADIRYGRFRFTVLGDIPYAWR